VKQKAGWSEISTIFDQALERPVEERRAWLADRCAGDDAVRKEVEALLDAHMATGLLDADAAELFPPPPVLESLEGRMVGPYQVIREIGRGGMGVVYQAHDPRLDRHVALKLLPAGPRSDAQVRARFLTEARAAAALDHPNICTIYDVGETVEGRAYIAMAYYDGRTLEQHLEDGPLDTEDALRIAAEVAAGLSHGHAAGVVHRDIKPANVMLCTTGEVKILDFGVAKLDRHETQTAPGTRIGTLAYMAPEQVRGEVVGPHADIWAVGVLLYELATARRPFRGDNDAAVLHGILEREPEDLEELPERLRVVVAKSLLKSPDRRYASASELIADLESSEPPAPAPVPQNLPTALTSFIGREKEIRAVSTTLQEQRLVTLTGPGGTGKTRLGLQVANHLSEYFSERVYFVPLAPITDPELVLPAIARAIGVAESSTAPLLASIQSILCRKPSLLVLDNFEQITKAAPVVGRLLEGCACLSILATSRVLLRITGEHEYPVSPLEAPDTEVDAATFPSVQLFVERAQVVRPGFELTPENTAAVAELCRRLDGLPLAIELAAARLRMFSPAQLLERLGNRLDLLKSRDRDRPARHQTLRTAIACSYEILTPAEQRLFRQLAVFPAGATIEAVEAVAGDDAGDVFDTLESLADHSLVRRLDGPDGEVRFPMLETIRAYSAEQLEGAMETDAARHAHADYFVALAELAGPELTGANQLHWLARLEAEIDNLRAAMDWASVSGDTKTALRLAASSWRYWLSRSFLTEAIRRLEHVLQLPAGPDLNSLRADVLRGLGTLSHVHGDYTKAGECLKHALRLYEELDDRAGATDVITSLSWVAVEIGSLDEAHRLGELALRQNVELGRRRGAALALNNLGWTAMHWRKYDEARRRHTEGLAIRREIEDLRGIGFALSNVAWAEAELGLLDDAEAHVMEAQKELERVDDKLLLSWNLHIQGRVATRQGRLERAVEILEESRQVGRKVQNITVLGWVDTALGDVLLAQGNCGRAREIYLESLTYWEQYSSGWGAGNAHYKLGETALAAGQPDEARYHFTESRRRRVKANDTLGIDECDCALASLGAAPHHHFDQQADEI
jgi:predicted ATPase